MTSERWLSHGVYWRPLLKSLFSRYTYCTVHILTWKCFFLWHLLNLWKLTHLGLLLCFPLSSPSCHGSSSKAPVFKIPQKGNRRQVNVYIYLWTTEDKYQSLKNIPSSCSSGTGLRVSEALETLHQKWSMSTSSLVNGPSIILVSHTSARTDSFSPYKALHFLLIWLDW